MKTVPKQWPLSLNRKDSSHLSCPRRHVTRKELDQDGHPTQWERFSYLFPTGEAASVIPQGASFMTTHTLYKRATYLSCTAIEQHFMSIGSKHWVKYLCLWEELCQSTAHGELSNYLLNKGWVIIKQRTPDTVATFIDLGCKKER